MGAIDEVRRTAERYGNEGTSPAWLAILDLADRLAAAEERIRALEDVAHTPSEAETKATDDRKEMVERWSVEFGKRFGIAKIHPSRIVSFLSDLIDEALS